MMKKLIFVILSFLSTTCFANLYLQTEYQEATKAPIVTKHHIFLDQRYTINYSKKRYVLILKKITGDEATIESESYDLDKIGHKTMHGGSYGSYKVGKSFFIKERGFVFKVDLEKIVPTKTSK